MPTFSLQSRSADSLSAVSPTGSRQGVKARQASELQVARKLPACDIPILNRDQPAPHFSFLTPEFPPY